MNIYKTVLYLIVSLFICENRLAQDAGLVAYPSTREVEPEIQCTVHFDHDTLFYTYGVLNQNSANQEIWMFIVKYAADSVKLKAPISWRARKHIRSDKKAIIWASLDSLYDIFAGSTISGFLISSTGLPSIYSSYCIGYIEPPEGEELIEPGSNNIFNNGFMLEIISPQDPPNPFDVQDFLDTLLNYNDRSYELEWIKDQQTHNKYAGYLNTVKSALVQDQNGLARSTLSTLLEQVDVDSSSTLTSEAYALLRFNSEYLLEQLPEDTNPNLIVNLIDSQGNTLGGGVVKFYEGGWQDAVDNGDGSFTVETDLSQVSLRMTYENASQTVSHIPAQNNSYSFQTVNAEIELRDSQGSLINEEASVKYYSGGWREFGTTSSGVVEKELLPNNYSFRITYAFASDDMKQDIGTDPTVVFQTVNTQVEFRDSQNNLIADEAAVNYYSGGWREFGTTSTGVVSKELLPNNYSFRLTYGFASDDKKQDVGADPTVVFQTVNTQVELRDSENNLITDEAVVKYYSGGWREFGTTSNGVTDKELLPNNYSFRMTYAYSSDDKKQDVGTDTTVVFQTVNTQVELRDSQNNLIADEAIVKYYSGGWREFGTTSNGIAAKELLPNNYSFRLTYAYASDDMKQDIGTDPIVVFQTVNTQVELRDSQNNLITDEAVVKYYSGGWREFGTTSTGIVSKELLPNNYSFRLTYGFASDDRKQDISADPTVVFQTVNTQVELRDSQNNLIADEAIVKYYSGGWREFGTTSTGVVSKELLPNNYSFRLTYGFASDDKKQDVGADPTVVFQTVNTQVELRDSENNLITDEAVVKYYSGGWREFGTTSTGVVSKELLPNNYSFRLTYAFASDDKKQDVSADPNVVFHTVITQVELRDSQNNLIADEAIVKYYSGGWREFGTTSTGVVSKELLPNNYSFRLTYAYASDDMKQDIGTDPIVVFQTVNTQVELRDSQNNLITDEAVVKYYSGGWREFGTTSTGIVSKELLPNNYSFRLTYGFASDDRKQDISADPTVVFQTVNTQVELRDSQNSLIANEAVVKYYSGGWREFGTTSTGVVSKELLPNNYSFRMTYAYSSDDKKQDVGTDPTVVFQTVNTQVELRDSQNNLIADEAAVKYYSGGWREFGTTFTGAVSRELLPNNYSFRMTYAYASDDKKQDIDSNPVVVFPTVNCIINVHDQNNLPLSGAVVKYYSGGWRTIGETIDGIVNIELLPKNLSFRVNYLSTQSDIKQDIGIDNNVQFILNVTE